MSNMLERCEASGRELKQLARAREDIRDSRIYQFLCEDMGRARCTLYEYEFLRNVLSAKCRDYKVSQAAKGSNEYMLINMATQVFESEPASSYNGFQLRDILNLATSDMSPETKFIAIDQPIIYKRIEITNPCEIDQKGRYKCMLNPYYIKPERAGRDMYHMDDFEKYIPLTDIILSHLIAKKDSPIDPYMTMESLIDSIMSKDFQSRIYPEDIELFAKQVAKTIDVQRTKYCFKIDVIRADSYLNYKWKYIKVRPKTIDTEWYKMYGRIILSLDKIDPKKLDDIIIREMAQAHRLAYNQ